VKSLQGRALVASPYLNDPNFLRSVVYILRHDDEGAFGLLLNRPLNISVGQLLTDLLGSPAENCQPVFCGGPVDGLVLMMPVNLGTPDEDKVIVVAGDQDRISEIANQKELSVGKFRLFDGYSGWGPSQLESELSEGSWLIWDIQPDQLFSDPDELWQLAIREIGRDIITIGISESELPQDPSNN
jgi:putative transcriptional regulator